MSSIFDLIRAAGYLGLFGIIFLESSFPIGIIFPGDGLLFGIGLFAANGSLNLWLAIILIIAGAIGGGFAGYWLGAKFGPVIFKKEKSLFFNKKYLEKTQKFYAKYGKKTIFIARFVPVIRTFAPIAAGMGQMTKKDFYAYNIASGLVWGLGLTLLGYGAGIFLLDFIDAKTLSVIVFIFIQIVIIASILPAIIKAVKENKKDSNLV